MKKLAAFIMLLMHMNYYMFIPQLEETDSYDASGQQIDDINSVVEYVRVLLGLDKTADDEDDDTGNNFTPVRTCEHFYQRQFTILDSPGLIEINNRVYCEYKIPAPLFTSYDIISPPPEA